MQVNKSGLIDQIISKLDYRFFFDSDPIGAIQDINRQIPRISRETGASKDDVTRAAVRLEILLDRYFFPSTGDFVHQGLPSYLPDGYIDMGLDNKNNGREAREKLKLAKDDWFEHLVYAKSLSCSYPDLESKIYGLYDYCFLHGMPKSRHSSLVGFNLNITIPLIDIKMQGGVCRHIAPFLQMLYQTAGIYSNLKKGNTSKFRHVWLEVLLAGNARLVVDPTWAEEKDGRLKRHINKLDYSFGPYKPQDDPMNNFKIKSYGISQEDRQKIDKLLIKRKGVYICARSRPKTADFGEIKSLEDVCHIFDHQPDLKIASFDFMDTLVQWTSSFSERHGQMNAAAEAIFKKYDLNVSAAEYEAVRNQILYQKKASCYLQEKDFKISGTLLNIVSRIIDEKEYQVDQKIKEKIALEIEDSICQIERKDFELVPGARETLKYLKDQGKKIVLYSNTPFSSDHIKATFDSFGIAGYFDKIFVSSEFGFQKSFQNPDGFLKLAWEIKQESDQFKNISVRNSTLHIGNNFNDDYMGALNAGLRAVYYNPKLSADQKINQPKQSKN